MTLVDWIKAALADLVHGPPPLTAVQAWRFLDVLRFLRDHDACYSFELEERFDADVIEAAQKAKAILYFPVGTDAEGYRLTRRGENTIKALGL